MAYLSQAENIRLDEALELIYPGRAQEASDILFSTKESRIILREQQEKDMSNAVRQAGANVERPAGFVMLISNDIGSSAKRVRNVVDRLNDLGARLLGSEQLPRNNRPTQEIAKTTDKAEPVRSDSEKVNHAIKHLSLAGDDLEEIVTFLEQL